MLTLNISETNALKFYHEIKTKISKSVNKKDGTSITDDEIKTLVIGLPNELVVLNNLLMSDIIIDFDQVEFEDYLKWNKIKRSNCNKYHTKIREINNMFDYSKIVGNDYFLAHLLNQSTCIHCNRNYTLTIGNKKNRIVRPEYDHWISKSKYPLLTLSFYNLVPSCSSCNKKKSSKDFTLQTHLNPYIIDEDEKKFKFSYKKKTLIDNNVVLKIETSEDLSSKKISNTFKDLNLVEIYNAHSNSELRDLLDLRYKYSENYIDILINKTFKGIMSKEEIYRMIFGIEINEEDYHKRPFSKFKHDIIEELKNIK